MGVRTASTITTSRPLPFCIWVFLRRSPAVGVCSTRRRAVALPGATVQDRLTGESTRERLGILGTGAIACGLARLAASCGVDVLVWARSDASAEAAGGDGIRVITDLAAFADRTFVVEAVIEDKEAKADLFDRVDLDDSAILTTTTSSLSIEELAAASGR